MKRAIGYVTRLGADKQKEEIIKYCNGMDAEVVAWVGEDGETFGSIAYGRMLTGRKYDMVVVADSAIVSTDVYEFYAYKSVLKRRHSDLMAVKSLFAGYELYVKLFDELTDTIARVELENDPMHRPHDRIDKAARGQYIGGRAPMGYKVENGQLVINDAEKPVVLFVIDRKHSGKTMLSTVDALNQDGYKTRNGKAFVISTVQSIWNNEMFYKGYYRYGKDGEWVKGSHEAILKDQDGGEA